jgi:hypothetical protein
MDGRTDGRTWRILYFLANSSQTDGWQTAWTSLSDIKRQARTQTTFASVFDVPICSVRVRMREYSARQECRNVTIQSSVPELSAAPKITKIRHGHCAAAAAACRGLLRNSSTVTFRHHIPEDSHPTIALAQLHGNTNSWTHFPNHHIQVTMSPNAPTAFAIFSLSL